MPVFPMQANTTSAAGGQWTVGYTLTDDNNVPLDLTGATFEFVVRTALTDTAEPALVSITATETSQGYLAVSGNTVLVVIYPPATALLGRNAWPYALWMNPGSPTTAVPLVEGTFYSGLVAAA